MSSQTSQIIQFISQYLNITIYFIFSKNIYLSVCGRRLFVGLFVIQDRIEDGWGREDASAFSTTMFLENILVQNISLRKISQPLKKNTFKCYNAYFVDKCTYITIKFKLCEAFENVWHRKVLLCSTSHVITNQNFDETKKQSPFGCISIPTTTKVLQKKVNPRKCYSKDIFTWHPIWSSKYLWIHPKFRSGGILGNLVFRSGQKPCWEMKWSGVSSSRSGTKFH